MLTVSVRDHLYEKMATAIFEEEVEHSKSINRWARQTGRECSQTFLRLPSVAFLKIKKDGRPRFACFHRSQK